MGLGNLYLFYAILTPITIYPVFWILSLFYNVKLVGITLIIGSYMIEIIQACVAGAAYYLLLALNLSTSMSSKKRIYSFIYLFSALLILNIIRIVFLSTLFVSNNASFDFTHKTLWLGISTIFVVIL